MFPRFEACFMENFCLQYSVFYAFVQAWNTQGCVHTVAVPSPCLCFCASILRFFSRKISVNVICKAFSRVQIKVGSIFIWLGSTNFPWLWMKKRDSLGGFLCSIRVDPSHFACWNFLLFFSSQTIKNSNWLK